MTDTDSDTLFSLGGKTILITGATGYLGSAMARAAARSGAHVLVNARSADSAAGLVSEISAAGFSAAPAVFDVTSSEAAAAWFDDLDGPLHVLVNNAYAGGAGSLGDATEAQFIESYEVSVIASQRLLRLALPKLKQAQAESGDASVINIATMYGVVAPEPANYSSRSAINPPFYGAAKAALLQWTRHAAGELGEDGIRVNAISPGPFPNTSVQNDSPELVAQLASRTPLGRIGGNGEIAGPVLFLASSASSYVTGANIMVDGGWTSW